jgi:DNA replication and repair protein RecF
MRVLEIQIDDFRSLKTMRLEPDERVSMILGRNGAGKTSIIEALYVAGRGASFRHREIRPWIRDGQKAAKIFVRTQGSSGILHRVGVLQQRSGKVIKVDGEKMRRRSQLVKALPLQLITPNSHDLIERGPGVRRRFLDWGLFHVERGFADHALRYRRALAQRNQALKRGDASFCAWDDVLAMNGEAIDRQRLALLPDLAKTVQEELRELAIGERIELALTVGWDQERGLLDSLILRRQKDRASRVTGCGAHRTVLDIHVNGVPAERRLSRGQQKLLVYALMFALARLIVRREGERPVILIDDLPAELDESNRLLVLRRTIELGMQAIVTATHLVPVLPDLPIRTFHVEHGRLTAD